MPNKTSIKNEKTIALNAIISRSFLVQSSVIAMNIGTIPIGLIRVNNDEKHSIKSSVLIFIYILSLASIPRIFSPLFNTILIESIKNNLEYESFFSSAIILWCP